MNISHEFYIIYHIILSYILFHYNTLRMNKYNAALVLQDGTILEGAGFGAKGTSEGEVVFNTSMTGYQEALTDPSYKYQILMMTYPLVGNYGVNDIDFESDRIHAEGFIIRELALHPSHGKLKNTLDEFLKEYDIPGIHGIDTRFLTRKIRIHGVMNGILKYPFDSSEQNEDMLEQVQNLKSISEFDLIDLVSIKKPMKHDAAATRTTPSTGKKTVVLIDCGVKHSIISSLVNRGINVIQVPARTSVGDIMKYEPDGVVISNGPGDPKRADYVVETVKKLIAREIPMFGICLGLQIMALACGAGTYKLKFGHRGSNQPVKDLKTGRIHITAQNHGFAVDAKSTRDANLEVSHINPNDQSIEGIMHKELPLRAVQYHPEAHPGPWDSYYLFDEFIDGIS